MFQSRFDRLVLSIVILLVTVLGVMMATATPTSTDSARDSLPPQILYTSLDEQFREQLFAADVLIEQASVDGSQQLTRTGEGVWDFTSSPDGSRIVYATINPDGSSDLWLIDRDQAQREQAQRDQAQPEEQSEMLLDCGDSSCSSPAWSDDGALIAFTRRDVASAANGGLNPPRVWLLDVESGETAPLFSDSQTLGFGPLWSSSGDWISYTVPNTNDVGVYNVESGEHLFYATQTSDGGIWHPGADRLLLSALVEDSTTWRAHLYLANPASGSSDLASLVNLSTADDLSVAVDDSSPAWSPDGEQIAFRRRELEGERSSLSKQLWIMNADGSNARALTNALEHDHGQPVWSPDGRYLLYHRFPLKGPEITLSVWMLNVETGEATELLSPGQRPQWQPGG